MELLKKFCPQFDLIEGGIVALALAVLVGLFGWQSHRIDQLKVSVATEKAGRSADHAAAASLAASAAIDRLRESERRIATNQEIDREASRLETLHHLDAVSVAAVSVDRGLRDAFRAAVSRLASGAGGGDPRPVALGHAGIAAGDLRADVFDEWDGRARILEAALDQAHARGIACQLEYAALKRTVLTQAAAVALGADSSASAASDPFK